MFQLRDISYKVRLVVKSYTQQRGMDYLDTFFLVVKLTTTRYLLVISAINNWHLHQLNVNNIFFLWLIRWRSLYALTSWLWQQVETQVCRLIKYPYELKQVSRQWFHKLSIRLLNHGFTQSKYNYSLFTRSIVFSFITILVYIINIIACGLISLLQAVQEHLKYFLRFEIACSSKKSFNAKGIMHRSFLLWA